jgi:hypothetical protein
MYVPLDPYFTHTRDFDRFLKSKGLPSLSDYQQHYKNVNRRRVEALLNCKFISKSSVVSYGKMDIINVICDTASAKLTCLERKLASIRCTLDEMTMLYVSRNSATKVALNKANSNAKRLKRRLKKSADIDSSELAVLKEAYVSAKIQATTAYRLHKASVVA